MSTNVNRGIENRLDLDRSYAELNFRGIRTIFYRNGDEYDSGTMVVLSRKQFKHWITFLDYLTKKLGVLTPVHKIHRTDGSQVYQVCTLSYNRHLLTTCIIIG